MFISGGIISIFVGLFCIWDSELAWRLYEMDSQMWGQYIEQPQNWRERVYYMGLLLMILGIAVVVLGLDMLV